MSPTPTTPTSPSTPTTGNAVQTKAIEDNTDAIEVNTQEITNVKSVANENQERVARAEETLKTNSAGIRQNTQQVSLMNSRFEAIGLQLDALATQVSTNTEQIQENTAGIAIANAMAGTSWLQANETHAFTANWGYYNNSNAFALSATQRLDKNWSANMGIGVSTDEGKVGARAGVRYGW